MDALMVDGNATTQIYMSAEYDYGSPDQPPSNEQSFDVSGGGGFWDDTNWNEFYWSSPVYGKAEAYLEGIGSNIASTILSDSTHEPPHSLSTLTLHFSYRGMER